MVHQGPRPAHRRGTVGRPWRRFRKGLVDQATHCQKCGRPFNRYATCAHPTHQGLKGCPTNSAYPTLEHPHRLVDGGAPRDPGNARVYCYSCNSGDNRSGTRAGPQPTPSRRW